jgi:transposase-like protein
MSGQRTLQVLEALEARPARSRRTWPRAAKEQIVAAASALGDNVSAVARAHGVPIQLVFRWRREALQAAHPEPADAWTVDTPISHTIKRDYARVSSLPDAETVFRLPPARFEHYNTRHPHHALGYRSPREFIADRLAAEAGECLSDN